jgi:hypothetical protein
MKLLMILVFYASLSFSQTSYVHGQSGIEIVAKDKDTMYVYQQVQAKMDIRREVAKEILNTYLEKKNLGGTKTVCTSKGEVTGYLTITRRKGLVLLNFQYLSILWNDGILEKTIIKKVSSNKKKVKK